MKLGIDLHNIRDGGGVNYMTNLCAAFDPQRHGFSRLVLFGAADTLEKMAGDNPFIEKVVLPQLSKGFAHRMRFLLFQLDGELRRNDCDMLYSPGGLYFGRFRPFGSISRNMMPFQTEQWSGYRRLRDLIRLRILRWANSQTFRRTDAMIFLTRIAKDAVSEIAKLSCGRSRIIPHGVNRKVFVPGEQMDGRSPSPDQPIHIVYPSRLEPYKHQLEAMEAVAAVRARYPHIRLSMCGPANPEYASRVEERRLALDPGGNFLHYVGALNTGELVALYRKSDLLLFASSCENLPNTLIEAMAAQIPVISSNCEPMPSVGLDGCLYVDPKNPQSIAEGIRHALDEWSATLSRRDRAAELANSYSWEKCADETFGYLYDVASSCRRK
ncbi:glycosyltransferase [Rhizobium sp. AG855]|uniref:glycosyltransferase n=1 Tax=Rhizobium sp. AG855 TaxID=2183898 RepID=UPI000E71F4EB|nr:glycosyltransferase [Rhizobium sp. AG855]RKE85542.1 glycosyltransferase involved in cell wall biosynthesis [Rhizobium sp. AG855]